MNLESICKASIGRGDGVWICKVTFGRGDGAWVFEVEFFLISWVVLLIHIVWDMLIKTQNIFVAYFFFSITRGIWDLFFTMLMSSDIFHASIGATMWNVRGARDLINCNIVPHVIKVYLKWFHLESQSQISSGPLVCPNGWRCNWKWECSCLKFSWSCCYKLAPWGLHLWLQLRALEFTKETTICSEVFEMLNVCQFYSCRHSIL